MKFPMWIVIFLSVLSLFWWADRAHAAPTTQTTTLRPGWNSVFLEVQPESTDPDAVFSAIRTRVESVWRWNPRTSTVEFIQDPSMPIPVGSEWLVYYPGDPVLTNLHAIHAETAYLVKLGGTTNATWSVTGEPAVPEIEWKANSFNFVGFHLTPRLNQEPQEPLFGEFFSSSPAHDGQEIYTLGKSGNWEQVTSPETTRMRRGEAFWVYCQGSSQFTGPFSAQPEQGSGLHYGATLSEQNLLLRNHSAAEKTVSLTLSALSDNVCYWVFKPTEEVAGWQSFPTPLELTIPAGDFQRLRLGVRRVGLDADTAYGANMNVTDGEGMEILLPLSVTGISYAGLWVGEATITKVNQPANASDPDTPVKAGSEFSFRLIVHADDSGKVRLLSQVIQMWQEGTWRPDPDNLGALIVDEPGHFVLLTDDALIPSYSGAALRDGQPVGRRISSPAFPSLTAAQGEMGGTAAPGGALNPAVGNVLSINITLEANDPTNPFRHLFHPDHKKADQSYEVTRDLTLTFADNDSEGRPITGIPSLNWGSSEIGGIYQEEITGLHKNNVKIEGTFVLHKVSDVRTLTQQ